MCRQTLKQACSFVTIKPTDKDRAIVRVSVWGIKFSWLLILTSVWVACVGVATTLVLTAPGVPRPALLTVLGDGTKHVVLEGVSPTAHRVTAGVDQSGGSVGSHWVLLLVERFHLGDIIHTGALTMLLLHLHVLGLQKLGKLRCHLGHTWVKLKITNMRGENQRKFLSLALSLFSKEKLCGRISGI